MGITGHYVDDEWNLKEALLDFVRIVGSHDGPSIARVFMRSMKNLNIHTKVRKYTKMTSEFDD